MTAQPAWQLPITHGLPSACGCNCDDLFKKHRFGARDIFDRLTRHRVRKEADEIAGMARLQRDADFAVGLEAANPGTVPGARIDDDKRPSRRIDLDAGGRHDPHQAIIDRPIKPAAVDDELGLVIEHVRNGFGQVLAILIAALAHHIQNSTLRCAASTRYSSAGANKPPRTGVSGDF